jgi:hypothetical protein
MKTAIVAALAAALVPAGALAQQPPPPIDLPPSRAQPPPFERQPAPPTAQATKDPGYCQYVNGVADANTALLVAPELFISLGVINAGEAEGGTPLGSPKGRLTLGVEYDFVELWKGLDLQDRAAAECRRYKARSALESAVRAGGEVGAAPALAARARVLAESLPHAERLLEGLREEVREAAATRDEVDVVRLRLDELRQETRGVVVAQARVESLPYGQGGTLVGVIDAYRAADTELEEIEGGLRKLDAWSLEVRGGYDEIFDVDQTTPLFGLVTLSFDLGGLWVPGANKSAAEGRRRWIEEDVMGADRRVSELIGQLHTVRQAEQARLEEVSLLVNDLTAQLDEVRELGTRRVRRYETFLFFELTRLRGEQAYLQAHLGEIDGIIGTVVR